ncbi:hypothetical protein ACIHFE_33245 [Streptomyces sp. NPDC052396]|uniref:hypothetical protein n=1 Tax=Streptomyces sp. NPDC052396 TaxID=3365689 RepID=UPI0037D5841C
MRPKLKSDVLYVPMRDGAHVFGAGADLSLTGAAAYQWLDRLAPHLNGVTDLDDLVRGLPADKSAVVRTLVDRLHEAGCLTDAADDLPHDLTDGERDTYAAEIAFIDYYADSAERRFQTYRERTFAVVGSGPVFTSLVCSTLRSGARQVHAVRTEESPTDLDRLAALAAEVLRRDPRQRLDHVTADGQPGWLSALDGAEVVLHVASGPAADRAPLLYDHCRARDILLVQGVVLDDVAWLGPAREEWRSAWLRLGARPPYRTGEFCTGPAAAVVASHLGLAAFKAVTGIATAEDSTVTRIDLETLRTSRHSPLPHPSERPAPAESRERFTERVELLADAGPLDEEEFSRRAARCFDPYAGVLREFDEQDFLQVPLNVTEVLTREPGAGRVFGSGLGFAQARGRAALGGLARYAASAAAAAPGRMAWGWDPHRRIAVEVPLADVLGTGTGLAAELGWDAAVTDGLSQHCAELALADVAAGRVRPVALAVDEMASGGRERGLLDMLSAAGGTADLADIGAGLGIPVLGWWQNGEPVAVTCGPRALADGLERALLHRQAALDGGAPYAPAGPPRLGPPPAPHPRAGAPVPPDGAAMLRALAARGWRPVVVPLDRDPAVHDVLPFVLKVVLADA